MRFTTDLPLAVPLLMLALRAVAWLPPLPPALAGPLLGVVSPRLAELEIAGVPHLVAALLLAILWITAPALLDFAPCEQRATDDAAVQ